MNRTLLASIVLIASVFASQVLGISSGGAINEKEAQPCLKEFLLPGYPPLARQILVKGDVSARIHVLTNGSVGSVTMVDGHPLLAEPVREALTQWKFEAPTNELDLDVTVRFSLDGTGKEGFPPQQIRASLPHLFAVSTTPPPPLGPDVEPLKPKRNTK